MIRVALFATLIGIAALPDAARADASRETVAAPSGTVVLKVHAIGAQIYTCGPDGHGGFAWSFREPIATLIQDGRTVGRHFAGPTWELADGSGVTGKIVDKAAGETLDDIPWLKLSAVGLKGAGELAGVLTVQRIATVGGNKMGPCPSEGALVAVPYAADYVFSK